MKDPKVRNLDQITEALGQTNRYFFWLETGRNSEEATSNELLAFYITHGGAKHYAETHENVSDDKVGGGL